MVPDGPRGGTSDDALRRIAPGPLLAIADGELEAWIAPDAGGRLARVRFAGVDWLLSGDPARQPMIGWGCYPMLPWAGRVRNGRFQLDGTRYRLRPNLDGHAIHGIGFGLPWRVDASSPRHAELSLDLPMDADWPFGGRARQRVRVAGGVLRMELSLEATHARMPAVIGWHPWFARPDRLQFEPVSMYARDAQGITRPPPAATLPGPWDDCFINRRPVVLVRGRQALCLTSDCDHWVVFDERPDTTCVEPQTGPPDAFNIAPFALDPGTSLRAWFQWEWSSVDGRT